MINLNEYSEILPCKLFCEFMEVFSKAWTKETAFYNLQNEWNIKNKALGQCTPTALVIYDYFGGKIAYDKGNFHVWNILPDGTHQDFCRSQFKENRDFVIYKYLTKEEILTNEIASLNNTEHKYNLLKKRIEKLIMDPRHRIPWSYYIQDKV